MPTVLKISDVGQEEAVAAARVALEAGKLIVMPTETVYGIAGNARMVGVLERLYEAKTRDRGKPVPLLVSGVDAALDWGAVLSDDAARMAERFWPGPLTIVLPTARGVEEGFRVPDFPLALAILEAVGGVLRVSSANVSGDPPALTAEEALQDLGEHVDLVIDAGRVSGGVPSTVVQFGADGMTVLRDGVISREALAVVLRDGPAVKQDAYFGD